MVTFQQNTKAIALRFGQTPLASLFNQSKSINFTFGHFSAKYQGYSLTFFAKNRSFSSLFNLQSKSINFKFGHFSATYQGYSLTFWPKIAHFHHFSICNQNQSISNLVIFQQHAKAIALLFGQQSAQTFQSAIKINQSFGHFSASLFGQKSLIFITFQSAIKINQFHIWSFFSNNTKAIALLFLPKIAHFHHFSICNQNQSISNLVIFQQHTKAIALLSGQKSLIFITFQSAIKINQFQIWSFFSKIPRLLPYFLAKHRSFTSLFNLPSQINQFHIWSFFSKIPRL